MYRVIQPALLVSCTSIQYKSTNKIEWQSIRGTVSTIPLLISVPSQSIPSTINNGLGRGGKFLTETVMLSQRGSITR